MYLSPFLHRLIEATPDPEWRLMIALARYGALRCPSEVLSLRWADIDFDRGRIRVPSPKTERHAGRGHRLIPLFREIEPYLTAVHAASPDGAEHVISKYRDSKVNLRTHMLRLIDRAGLKPWPRLWQNLRASRATELAAVHPAHVAAAWCGHTVEVATGHYWSVQDSDFDKARGDEKALPKALPLPRNTAGFVRLPPEMSLQKTSENTEYAEKTSENKYPLGESNPCMQTENLLS